jgi:hypothetical protein
MAKKSSNVTKALAKGPEYSPIAEGWIQVKPCRAAIAGPDIVAGQPERKLSRPYVLQTPFGKTIPAVKEALVELTLGRRPLRIWVLVADITDYFILGLDMSRAYEASLNVGQHALRLARKRRQ